MRLALYQPDLPPNVGTLIRLGACLDVPLDIIEPCGFPLSERSLKRAAMDYAEHAELRVHADWDSFRAVTAGRLVLLTTRASEPYTAASYRADDVLLLGRESAGVPEEVHAAAGVRVRIPLAAGRRSLNVATAAAMVLGEALRQTEGFPP